MIFLSEPKSKRKETSDMTLIAVILLGLILLVLIGILLLLIPASNDLQRYCESIHARQCEGNQSLNFISDRVGEVAEKINRMYHIAAAIQYALEHPSLYNK
jgi:hypothetical protein